MENQDQVLDYNKLQKEAQIRWLKPVEIHYILWNHERYPISEAPPEKPTSGSIYLFNRRVLRNFRKDGHSWRKKKDGRNVGEAHEKLKVGSVFALNCYYAHGAQNPHFQRRSFWLLDREHDHIVLVHYREVSEGRFLYGPMSALSANSGSTLEQNASVNKFTSGTNGLCQPNGSSSSPDTVEEISSDVFVRSNGTDNLYTTNVSGISTSAQVPELSQALRKLTEQLSLDEKNSNFLGEEFQACFNGYENSIEGDENLQMLTAGECHISQENPVCGMNANFNEHKEENDTDWIGPLDFTDKTYISDFQGTWFDESQFDAVLGVDPGLTVVENQRFSIREISPEWAFSSESTKVIITGDFLCDPSEIPWAVMFGSIEVPAVLVQQGVLRCQTPQLDSGKVPIYITCRNRQSCSEVRYFEFHEKPTTSTSVCTSSMANMSSSVEESLLLVRLAHMLLYGSEILSKERGHSGMSDTKNRWSEITEALIVGSEVPFGTLDWVLQELLKDKLQKWLSSKNPENEDNGYPSKHDQGILHMISGLGYEWALNPILDSGVNINFRDANGWTALHWAARFGREEMLSSLLANGASARALTDPTHQDPAGKTAAAIAAANGYSGLAGYLSEAELTTHLSSLTMEENEISLGSAQVEAERAIESISQRSEQMHVGGAEDELSLKDSLAAVRNAAQAAARIQAAFRAHSFRKRLEKSLSNKCEFGLTQEEINELSRSVHSSRDRKGDAALSIQKNYRGYKGRKDFLTLRRQVVKIQAHFRGHRERKKYKELLWTVNVLEKIVLRWRKKGVGLRGYRAAPGLLCEGDEEDEDIVRIFRKEKVNTALDQAVSRVLSMVESPTARQQYRRMLQRYRLAKAFSDIMDEELLKLDEDCESDGFMN